MASVVEICSTALLSLGSDPITDLEDGTKKAMLCKYFYPLARDAVLRSCPWNCAKVVSSWIKETWTPETDDRWGFRYVLPTDPYCLWVPKRLNEDLDYEIRGRRLYTDEDSPILVTYIQRMLSTTDFDVLLQETISARLAHYLAYPITGTASLAVEAWKLYKIKLQEAMTQDGMEGSMDENEQTTLTDVRL